MTATRQLIEKYLQGWNETDPLRRRTLIEDVYAEHAAYVDPMVEARGWEAIDATIAAVQNMFPGHLFRLAGEVDAHHDIARFHWHLAEPGAADPLVIGFDVVVLDYGRIRQVHGFLDKVPMAA
ncbi:polyketide cyclase [Rhodanobacter thiooxydans]|uniref:Polyketide cyclase n=1 Tax=Rhodanobacter thiooxydans TaxID=416169 RepID=A0A154QJJ0_9GAMM|nr:nuclear transport factor 2 family protein [Rhodanobacter thiooxydans]EIM02367.1 hypothetical protein UUA_02401 [Rhodanobacter thiooxydans LCS2]KZC24221.1 polyketide cyclase [Rhodanobacter thiooxydans]MCW0200806.1 nuclear transport factor 2 family protein [Rhodanobacter thiooxydans]